MYFSMCGAPFFMLSSAKQRNLIYCIKFVKKAFTNDILRMYNMLHIMEL